MSQSRKKLILCAIFVLITLIPPIRRCAGAGLLAILCAIAAARPVQWLERHRIPRWLGVALVLGGAAALLVALLACTVTRLCCVVDNLTGLFPDFSALFRQLIALAGRLPGSVGNLTVGLLTLLSERSSALPEQIVSYATKFSAKLLSSLPEKLFFVFIGLLGSFYAASDWPRLRRQLLSLVPEDWSRQAFHGLQSLKTGALGWLKAQGKLILIQFVVMACGMFLLHMRGALAVSALVAVSDALPLFGCGVILLPWAAILWLQGNVTRAAGMVILWLCLWLLRTVLEPRFVGKQAGASPFFTLLAMYLGLLCFGFWGLIVAPMVLAAGTQLFNSKKSRGRDH